MADVFSLMAGLAATVVRAVSRLKMLTSYARHRRATWR
jgi:hypothetical protein